jgi:hypothetical protein
MKFIYIILLSLLVSCGTTKKTFICGDRQCIDKKEFKEYFDKNLIVEIQTKKQKKNLSIDLAKLNTLSTDQAQKNNSLINVNKKNQERTKKIALKSERALIKEQRKIKKSLEKKRIKEEKKLIKTKKNPKTEEINNVVMKEKRDVLFQKSSESLSELPNQKDKTNLIGDKGLFKSIKTGNQLSVCAEIKECDIDKISELLIKKGIEKDFPDISSN